MFNGVLDMVVVDYSWSRLRKRLLSMLNLALPVSAFTPCQIGELSEIVMGEVKIRQDVDMRSRMPPVSGMWWRGSVVCPLQRTSPYSSKSGKYPPPRPCVKITEVSRISSKQSCSWLHKRPFERPCRSYCSKTCSTMEDACGIDNAEIHSENWAVSVEGVRLSARDMCVIWRVFCLPSPTNRQPLSCAVTCDRLWCQDLHMASILLALFPASTSHKPC